MQQRRDHGVAIELERGEDRGRADRAIERRLAVRHARLAGARMREIERSLERLALRARRRVGASESSHVATASGAAARGAACSTATIRAL